MTLEQAKSLAPGTKVRINTPLGGEGPFLRLHSDEVILVGTEEKKMACRIEEADIVTETETTEAMSEPETTGLEPQTEKE